MNALDASGGVGCLNSGPLRLVGRVAINLGKRWAAVTGWSGRLKDLGSGTRIVLGRIRRWALGLDSVITRAVFLVPC